ncbi:MAG: hypothetical protein V3T53_04665 [Phycisphaerales bacterium]
MQSTTLQETVKPGRRAGSNLRSLLAINAALLGLLALVSFAPAAGAQGRGRGDYTMVGGGANGANSAVVYIIDAANQEMIAATFNVNTRVLDGVGYRNLAQDAAQVLRSQTPGR